MQEEIQEGALPTLSTEAEHFTVVYVAQSGILDSFRKANDPLRIGGHLL